MFIKVQLLVTSQDVDNYKQIKQDLDQLRSIVEKSELWVYKGQGPDETMDGASGENEHKKTEVSKIQVRRLRALDGLLETRKCPFLVLDVNAVYRQSLFSRDLLVK
jgi:hypothetical protein